MFTSDSVKKGWETRRRLRTDKLKNGGMFKKGQHPWNYGLTKENDERVIKHADSVSKALIKNKSSHLIKMNKSRIGQHLSDETKEKIRIKVLESIEKIGGPSIGHNEKLLLDMQEKIDNCKIIRQYNTEIGYTVDGYCKETNTVYEIYEKHHNKQVFKDLERENNICNKLSCDFIIIWDD